MLQLLTACLFLVRFCHFFIAKMVVFFHSTNNAKISEDLRANSRGSLMGKEVLRVLET